MGVLIIGLLAFALFLFLLAVFIFIFPLFNFASGNLYDLSHATLHPPVPIHPHDDLPVTLWQNMGYWPEQQPPGKISTREYPKACVALLEKILSTAGWDTTPVVPFVVELGFGCGDSAWEIFKGKGAEIVNGKKRWNVGQYIGISNNKNQLALSKGRYVEDFDDNIRFEFGNGGAPDTWKKNTHDIVGSGRGDDWVLAIDSLYHMDRQKLFTYISSGWNIAAYDLILSDTASGWQLRCFEKVSKLLGIPHGNLLTQDEYTALLVAAGWDLDNITIEDISPHVFSPLSVYLKQRPQLKWKISGLLFGWLGAWGGIRGCIVVAKTAAKGKRRV